jgi:Fe-S cluster biogenesis protein NfuA
LEAGELREETIAEVRRLLELIRPAIRADGGDIEFVDLTSAGVVRVRLHGACVGCPSSSITLQTGVARTLRERVSGVTGVEAVDADRP